MIQFKGKITEKEYTSYLKTHLLFSTSISKMFFLTILIWPVNEVINLIMSGKHHVLALTITFALILVESGCVLGIVYYIFFRLTTLKSIKGLKEGEFFDEKEYTFCDESISIVSELSMSTTSWKAIKRIRDKNDFYFLYLNAVDAIVIPKRYFNSEELGCFNNLIKDIEIVN